MGGSREVGKRGVSRWGGEGWEEMGEGWGMFMQVPCLVALSSSGLPAGIHDPVSDKPTFDERVSHRIITPPSQCMYIMADLRKMDG